MLPAADLAEIISSLASLKLEPTTTAAVLGAVLAPLIRSADPDPPALPHRRTERPQVRPRVRPQRAAQQKRKTSKPRMAAAPAGEPKDGPRQRARAALKANPGVSLTRVAEIAKCSRSTVANAARDGSHALQWSLPSDDDFGSPGSNSGRPPRRADGRAL